jgi:hypothetical protein
MNAPVSPVTDPHDDRPRPATCMIRDRPASSRYDHVA